MSAYKILFFSLLIPFLMLCMDTGNPSDPRLCQEEFIFCNHFSKEDSMHCPLLTDENFDKCTQLLVYCSQRCKKDPQNNLLRDQFKHLLSGHSIRRYSAVAAVIEKKSPNEQDIVDMYTGLYGSMKVELTFSSPISDSFALPMKTSCHKLYHVAMEKTSEKLHNFLKNGKLDAAKTLLLADGAIIDWEWSGNAEDLQKKRDHFLRLRLQSGLAESLYVYGDFNLIEVLVHKIKKNLLSVVYGLCRYNRNDMVKEFICKYRDQLYAQRYDIYAYLITTVFNDKQRRSMTDGQRDCETLKIVIDAFKESVGTGNAE